MGGWKVTTAAAEALISTADMKTYLKVENSADDTLIAALVSGATEHAQRYLSQAFVTQSITEKLDRFDVYPMYNEFAAIQLSVNPVQSITSITYVDSNGATQTLSSSLYVLDNYRKRAVIAPAYGQSWPSARTQVNAITVVYSAGYGASSAVPEDIKQAVRLAVSDAYENRTDSVKQLPTASKWLLDRVNYAVLL